MFERPPACRGNDSKNSLFVPFHVGHRGRHRPLGTFRGGGGCATRVCGCVAGSEGQGVLGVMQSINDGATISFVVNPISGRAGGRRGAAARRAVEMLRCCVEEVGGKVCMTETSRAGDAGAVAERACVTGAAAVVVVGGDGTVNEVVGGMTGEGVPIVIVPAGTENVLAKYFGIVPDGAFIWRMLREGVEARIDVAEAGVTGDSGEAVNRRFILMGGIGFDAAIVLGVARRRREMVRSGGGRISHWTYLPVAWDLFWRYRHPWLRVEVDGESIEAGQALVLIGNVPRYAMGLRPWRDARADDGLLEMSVFPCRRGLDLVQHFSATFIQPRGTGRGVIRRQGRRVRVSSPETMVPVQVDGDYAGWLPAEFELSGGRARFVVPREMAERQARGQTEVQR